jgi:hypothetical protein
VAVPKKLTKELAIREHQDLGVSGPSCRHGAGAVVTSDLWRPNYLTARGTPGPEADRVRPGDEGTVLDPGQAFFLLQSTEDN